MVDKTKITREECIDFCRRKIAIEGYVAIGEQYFIEAIIDHLTTPNERELPELPEGVFVILESTRIESEPWMCSICVDFANGKDFSVMGKTPRAAVLAAIQAIKGETK